MSYPIVFIHVDILGFKKRTKLIAEEKKISESNVRLIFKNVIQERLKLVKNDYHNCCYIEHATDSWMITLKPKLSSNPLIDAFHIVYLLDENDLGLYIENDKVELEIAIGLAEYSKPVSMDFKSLESKPETISLMSLNLSQWYHQYSKMSIRRTFIAITKEIYEKMNFHNQDHCSEIQYETKPIFYILDLKRIREIGNVIEFSYKVSHSYIAYLEIDWIFVPPQNYLEIKNNLKNKKFCIISGESQYGKTFTSIRLLWDFFIDGFKVLNISSEEFEKDEHQDISLNNEPLVIYIEDPFGKEYYKSSNYIEQKLKDIINSVRQYENCYLIITMNNKVVQDYFNQKVINIDEVVNENIFTISLNSYTEDQRELLIKNYAKKNKCIWYKDNEISTKILRNIRSHHLLGSPFSITRFTQNTLEKNNLETLKNEVEKITSDILKYISNNIQNFSDPKFLFLILLYTCNNYSLDKFQNIYEILSMELISDKQPIFEEILKELIDYDYITIINEKVNFGHVSYKSAIRELISNITQDKKLKKYLEIILKYLSLSEDQEEAALTIYNNFPLLPKDLINELVSNLSLQLIPISVLALIIEDYYDLIKSEIIFRIIEKTISLKGTFTRAMVKIVIEHYEDMPSKLRKRIEQIAQDGKLNHYIIDALGLIPLAKKLPIDVRIRLIESIIQNGANIRALLGILTLHYSYKEFRDEYLPIILKILEIKPQLLETSYNLYFNYSNFDENFHNEYVRLIKKYPEFGIRILVNIYDNFETISSSIIYLLEKLTDSEEFLGRILIILNQYFDRIVQPLREHLIIKLYETYPQNQHLNNLILNKQDYLSPELRTRLGFQ